jgi:hypothetical protein
VFYNESMPFSYDIEPNDSSRLRRHMSRVKSDDAQRIEVKALGMNLGQLARGAQVFDPNAYDGDEDGLVQDGTPFERPAVLSNIASIARGLASTTGGYGSYTPAGSWTVGLTNEEVAERAIPDNPAVFVGMLNAQGPMGSTDVYLLEALNDVIFDPEGVAKLRQSLIKTLDDRPALRAAFDRFGCPPIGLHPKGKPYKGQAHGHYAIFINEQAIDEGAISRWLSKTPALAKLFNESMIAPKIKGVKRAFSGDSAEDTITHEWGHYLNYTVANIAPDAQLRELAAALASDSWSYAQWRRTAFTSLPKGAERLFSYFADITSSENWNKKHELPDEDVPFVKSVYGTTSPVEFFAESVQAYFSPNPRDSELLNYEGTVLVEQMLGIRQVSRGGFSSSTSGLKSGTGNTLRGKTPQEIADIAVPKTKEEAIALADAHIGLLIDLATGLPYTASEPDTLKLITRKGIDGMDFSPEAVSRMKEMVVEALSNNPNFYEAVQRFGMPPVMITKPGERLDAAYAIAGVEGFPAITIDSTIREKALIDGFPNGMYQEDIFIEGTSEFLVNPTSDGMFIHEWGHFLNRLAYDAHQDEEMRDLARFWWNETWDLDEYLPKIGKLLRRFAKPETRVDARYFGAQRFGKTAKNNKSVDFTGYPHMKTQYGQLQPAEAFAEAIAAVLSSDVNDKELVSPELRKDVLDIIGFSPSAKEVDKAGSSEGRSAGFASKTVTKGLGTRIIDKSDPFTPLSGPDWLKDATDEEIAEAVVPTSMDDAIALTVMNTAYGADPANFPTEATVIAELTERLLFKAECTDSTGALIRDANGNASAVFDIPIDFTPEGRQKAKDMIKRMMAESPEFAWMIRRFGCPAVLIMDEQKLTDLRNQVQALRDSGMDIQLPAHLDSDSIGGFSIATLGITLRTNPGRDDLPMGFNRGLAAKRKTGKKITNPDGTIEDEVEHWMNNFGISLADVGIHEWGHWFYSTVLGNKLLYKTYGIRGRMGDRQSRLSYLFPGVPIADVEKMTKEFLDAFDAEGFIPFNTMSEMHIDSIAKAAYRSIGNNLRNKPLPEQLLAAQRFTDLIQDYLNNVVNTPRGWSPSRAQEFADQIALEFPYLVNDMPPLIAGTYATATRQELWAEAILLFSSPDSKLKAKYLTPEIEAFIAYAFGLKPDRDPNIPYQKPWAERSNLSSSSRVRRLHEAEDSIPDRVSEKDDELASRTTGESTATMSREASSTSRFSVGDYEFDITDEDLSTYDWDTAYDQWTTWSGNWRMRHLSSAMMGIEQQPTKGGEESLSTVHEIMRSGELSNAPDHVKDSVRESLINTYKTMEKISIGETVSDRPLYRGLGSVPDDSEILMAEQGETITFPLSAFTPDRSLATTFADMNAENDKKVILQLRDGAHVASSDYTTQIRDSEDEWVEVPIESVTQGEFTVVSKTEKDGYTVVELSHTNTFDPLAGRMVPTNIRAGFASRSTGVVGKDFDGILEGLEAEDEPYDGRIKRILKNDLLKKIKELTSGELEERPIHSRLEKFKKRLLDSIRIEIGDDDIPMIMADPNPLIFQFMPDRRDWSKVRLPTLEIIKEAAKHIRENQSEEVSNENYEDVEEVFYRRLLSLLESTSEGSAEEDIGESVGEGWLSLYLTGLSRPMVTSQTGTGFENDVHDAFGHVGIGRGFDRHGEWANALSVMTMLDLPMFDDFTPEQKDGLKRMMLDKLAYPHFQKIPGDIGQEKSDGWWTRMTYGYTGDIQTVIDMLDVSDRTQVLNEDGSPKEVRRSGFSSISGASRSDISAIAQQDFVHIREADARSGFASSSMRPERRVSDSAIRTLTDNMDFLRDNPPIGKGGKDLDDQWAQKTIEKLRSGEISQEDAFDLMNVVIEILNNGFKEDPSQKENPDGKLLAYQKLSKRLRRLAVGAMDKDDMEDFRREQGIGPTAITEPKPGPYPGGRFGFNSTTGPSGFSSTTRDAGRNREVSAEYTQGIFGKLKALKGRIGYGTDFEEKVSKEKLDTRTQETAEYAKRIIDYYFKEDVVLPQRAIDYIKQVVEKNAFFSSDKRGGGVNLMPIQAALMDAGYTGWPLGDIVPPTVALEISRQIHIARGDTEMVAKIDEFKNYLKTVTPEQLSEDIRAASLVYGESIDKRVLVRTRSVNPFIKGSRTILTQHDREEREAAGVESMNMMGDGITTSARRKVEWNLLGLPFEEGVEDSSEVRELRPTSGYVTTSKTALARKEKFKEIYGDDVELMYDGPAGTALEHSQNNTGKYGPSQFVLRPAVAERTRVFDADTIDMSLKDNPPLQLSSLGEDGMFLGGTTNPIGMLYDYKTGDTYPTPSGAFEGSSDNGQQASYKEALVLGRFKPEEVEAIIAGPKDFRKESGELSERFNADNEANFSLLIDMAQSRDELMREHGIEVVPKIEDGVFRTDDVEMFNPSMTDVWFDKNFGDRGLSKEEIIPDKSTTPYEAYLRVLIATGELPEMFEYRGPGGKSEEEKDSWKKDALKKELARVEVLKSASRSGFSSSTQLTPTDDVEEAKRTGRPLSVLRPGTMPPKTQLEYDKITTNLDNLKTEARRIISDPTIRSTTEREKQLKELFKTNSEFESNLEKYKELVRAMEKEYKKLGFKKSEVKAIVYAITNHLEQQHKRAFDVFQDDLYHRDNPFDDAARLQQSVEVLEKADIAISFPKELLESLIRDGRFKTQFETNTSRGSLFPEARAETDIGQFGYHPDTAPQMRPVYGYLTTGGIMDKDRFRSIKIYGELQFVLKKDTHSRSTYATHDTLGMGITPSPMGVPSAKASGYKGTSMYAEAQIHGGLSLSDVDYVTVNVGQPSDDWNINNVSEEEFESISGMLAQVGIRVVPVRDGEVLDIWNDGEILPEPPADIIPEPEPDKVVA